MQIPTLWGHSIVTMLTRLWGGQSRTRDFLLLQNVQISSGAYPAFCSVVMRAFSTKKIGQDVRPTTHVHLGVQQSCDSFIFCPPKDCSEMLHFHIKKFGFSQQLFNEDANIKLYNKSSSGSQVDKHGQMEGHM